MEEARRKLRVCLICIVAVAIVLGFIYYFGSFGNHADVSEGTLVWLEQMKQFI